MLYFMMNAVFRERRVFHDAVLVVMTAPAALIRTGFTTVLIIETVSENVNLWRGGSAEC